MLRSGLLLVLIARAVDVRLALEPRCRALSQVASLLS